MSTVQNVKVSICVSCAAILRTQSIAVYGVDPRRDSVTATSEEVKPLWCRHRSNFRGSVLLAYLSGRPLEWLLSPARRWGALPMRCGPFGVIVGADHPLTRLPKRWATRSSASSVRTRDGKNGSTQLLLLDPTTNQP